MVVFANGFQGLVEMRDVYALMVPMVLRRAEGRPLIVVIRVESLGAISLEAKHRGVWAKGCLPDDSTIARSVVESRT